MIAALKTFQAILATCAVFFGDWNFTEWDDLVNPFPDEKHENKA
jgi:hypothetical protein